MSILFSLPEWAEIFVPNVPLLETIIRGTLMYLGLVILLRVILKRETGSLSISDLLMVMLLSEASQNAMATNARSVGDGLLLALTIIGWSYLLDWMAYHVPGFQRLMLPAPLPLVKDGRLLRKNMRKELITLEELMSALRENGIEEIRAVKSAVMESNGQISVVSADQQVNPPPAGSSHRRN